MRPGAAVPEAVVPGWVDQLFGSAAYTAQRRLAGRGGRLSQTGLAQALAMPDARLPGVVNAARRVLNPDQAQVLWIDGRDVVLDQRLLRTQFELDAV